MRGVYTRGDWVYIWQEKRMIERAGEQFVQKLPSVLAKDNRKDGVETHNPLTLPCLLDY